MVKYTCKLCLKEFRQKVDYTRHTNKKNACVSIDQLRKIEEKKSYNDDSQQQLTTLFASCMNILRDLEHLTGDKALRNLSYLLVLRLIEPMNGKEIDFNDHSYTLGKYQSKRHKLIEYTKFSKIATSEEEDIPAMLGIVWNLILSQHPKTKDIFLPGKGFDIKKQRTFVRLVKKLNEFDFSSVSVDIQGHAYEDLLKEIMTGKVLGQYFTQPLVKDLMVEVVNPRLHKDGTCETIFDPAMGTGGFLMTSLAHMKKQAEIEGIEIDWNFMTSKGLGGREAEPDTFVLTKTNMFMTAGHMLTGLEQGDSIRNPITNKYDIILANPPFGIKGLDYREIESHLRDSYMPIESKSAVPLFLQSIISILKVGGRCCMVMPDGQELFGKSRALVALREYLMKTCDLKEIYFMPSGVFSNTSIKTCVVYFHKKKEGVEVVKIGGKKTRTYKFSRTHQTKKVKFYDYNPYEKVKNLLVEVDIDRMAENSYSLNYAEYLEEEEEEEDEEMCGGVEWKTLGEVMTKNITKITLEDDNKYTVIGMSSLGYSQVKKHVYGNEIKMKRQQPTINGQFVISKILNYCHGFIIPQTSGGILSTEYWIFDVNNSLILSKYLDYIFNDYIRPNLKKISNGVGIPRINYEKFKLLKIPVPPLSVQQTIVEKLDFLYEQSIKTSEQRIEELKRERGMWMETLTLGVEEKTMGEVCNFEIGGTPARKTKEYWENGDNKWVSVRELNGGYIYDTKEKITDRGVEKSSVKLFQPETVLFSFKLSIGKTGIVGVPLYSNEAIAGINSKNSSTLLNKFIYYYLTITDYSDKGVGAMSKGSLNKRSLAKLKIPVPPLSVQQTIVERCEQIDALIAELEQTTERNKELAKLVLDKSIQNCSESEQDDEKEEEYTQIVIDEEKDYEPSDSDIVILDDSDEDEEKEDEPETLTVEILRKKNCKELRVIAKERSISGRSKMKKAQLIEAIMS